MQEIFEFLSTVDPLTVYGLVLGLALLENLFPPAPSDMMIIAAGTLVGLGQVGFVPILLSATAGSVIGFVIMYKIGDWFGDHILEQGKIKFLPIESVHKVERWFVKYGYAIIVVNRFLTGTRAVVSFFAGMSELRLWLTTVLCFVSALIWNAILVTMGMYLGRNWDKIGFYLSTYSQVVTAVVVVLVLLWVAKVIYSKRANAKKGA
ncbi:MAG TPA: DedA family protein [Bacteroidota bacterium]|nr:DedA family protein [Bacteroidota bacterium]